MSPRTDILVTIGMCVHNGEAFIRAALDSARAQTHENLEILVYDDGSTDGTLGVLEGYHDPRLTVIRGEQKRGLSYGRNLLRRRARGAYLTWLDADDVYHPDRVECLLGHALETGADISCDVYQYMSPGGQLLQQWHRIPDKVACEPHFTRLFERNVMIPHPLISATCFKTLQYDPLLHVSEDYDFWLQCSYTGRRFARFNKVTLFYRDTPNSMSKDPSRNRQMTKKILSKYNPRRLAELYLHRGYSLKHANYMLCLYSIYREEYRQALEYARRPWPGEPDVDQAFYLGTLYLRIGQFDAARRYLEHHLTRHPTSPAGYNNLAVLLKMRGQPSQTFFHRALELLPGYTDARLNICENTRARITDTQLASFRE